MKYFILRCLDVAGLKVLEPIIRLITGEEPMVQVKKIGLFIVIPIITFLVFLGAWAYVGPRHKTKSGEVPDPSRVLEAWDGIVKFADREEQKASDFSTEGELREAKLERVNKEYLVASKLSEISSERFKKLETARDTVLQEKLSKMQRIMELQEKKFELNASKRESLLLDAAAKIAPSDAKSKKELLAKIIDHLKLNELEDNGIKAMRSEIDEARQEKWGVLEKERQRKTRLDQMKQYLSKREQLLTTGNRSTSIENLASKLEEEQAAYLSATTGPELLSAGKNIIRLGKRIKKTEESEYVGPPSLFEQTWTSLKCVFVGFLIATAIAVPIGVLCGLSDVFMAAMSPLISLFKPVSPIVWLPIVFIIVGGFELPEVKGRLEWLFEPAFLASSITVALCSLWPTLVNTALGVASIDKDHVNVARVLRLGFWSRLFKIVIPSALPLIFAGLRISLGVGWMVLIAAELLSSSPGLGKYVWDMFNNGSSETFAQMFVVVFVVGLIGLLLDRMMIVFQRLVSFDGAATAL